MVNINLLPWREELRLETKKRFFIGVGSSVVAGLIVVILMHWFISMQISHQQKRNTFIQTEIAKVSAQITQNKDIKDQEKALLGKITAMQALYNSRFRLVSILDEVVKLIPKRVYLIKVTREGDFLMFTGNAASNAQVTQFMKNISNSSSLMNPVLQQITVDQATGSQRHFQLQAMQQKGEAAIGGGV